MDAVKYQEEKARMTCNCLINCKNCDLSFDNNNKQLGCREFELKYPEKAVEIVEKWAKEHPVKTRQSEFLKMFPNVDISNDVIGIVPCLMDCKTFKPDGNCKTVEKDCRDCCREYWFAEVE